MLHVISQLQDSWNFYLKKKFYLRGIRLLIGRQLDRGERQAITGKNQEMKMAA
jgi:hypothetical protein